MSLNRAILLGRVGKDPDMRRTSRGDLIGNFSVATSEKWKDRQTGERKERTEWHNVVVYNDHLAHFVEKYVQKGSRVYIEGKIQTREYEDKSGVKRRVTEIVLQGYDGNLLLLSGGRERGSSPASDEASPSYGKGDLDDDIPF